MEDVHIISNRGKWGIYKRGKYRSVRNFKYRDLAFHHACMRFKTKIIVHNTDGGVDFIEHNLN
jgi:hypothetical protein